MPRTNRPLPLIDFKGTTMPVVVVTLRSVKPDELADAARVLLGGESFFDGDAALLDLSQIVDVPEADWRRVKQVLMSHGLNAMGVRGGSEQLRYSAAFAGLPTYDLADRPVPLPAAPEPTVASPPPPIEPEPAQTPTPATQPAAPTTVYIDRPLRSGQQVYARGADLVVLAAVNPGAEVIADGNIHIYAPLRGRALAGASGSSEARILCTRFEAELVSVAGLYRTFEPGVPVELAGRAVQVRLSAKSADDTVRLVVESLRTD